MTTSTSQPEPETTSSSATSSEETGGVESSGVETTVPPDLPSPPTCREIIECMLGCLVSMDMACMTGCAEGADPAEGEAALALMTCVIGRCVEIGQCSLADLQLEDCMTCVGVGLMAPEPTNCEEEAAACT
jgi:hypothetical protein